MGVVTTAPWSCYRPEFHVPSPRLPATNSRDIAKLNRRPALCAPGERRITVRESPFLALGTLLAHSGADHGTSPERTFYRPARGRARTLARHFRAGRVHEACTRSEAVRKGRRRGPALTQEAAGPAPSSRAQVVCPGGREEASQWRREQSGNVDCQKRSKSTCARPCLQARPPGGFVLNRKRTPGGSRTVWPEFIRRSESATHFPAAMLGPPRTWGKESDPLRLGTTTGRDHGPGRCSSTL